MYVQESNFDCITYDYKKKNHIRDLPPPKKLCSTPSYLAGKLHQRLVSATRFWVYQFCFSYLNDSIYNMGTMHSISNVCEKMRNGNAACREKLLSKEIWVLVPTLPLNEQHSFGKAILPHYSSSNYVKKGKRRNRPPPRLHSALTSHDFIWNMFRVSWE